MGDLVCSAGHANPPSNLFCGICGQELDLGPDRAPGEEVWAALGIHGEFLRELQSEGITAAEAWEWHVTGLGWLEWRESEFTLEEAKSWSEIDVYLPEHAVGWLNLGLPRSDVAILAAAGLHPEEWPKCAAAGFSPSEAARWTTEFLGYNTYGIEAGNIAGWRTAGFNLADALKLADDGLEPREAGRWKAAGFSVAQTIDRSDGSDAALEAAVAEKTGRQRERDYPAGPMDKRAADALLKSLVKDRGLSATITINNGRGPFSVKSPVWVGRVAVFGTGSVYIADGVEFTPAQVVNITVKGRV